MVQDRDSFSLKLEDVENWLYEDGEDQQKQVYIDKLAELKVTTSTGGTSKYRHVKVRKYRSWNVKSKIKNLFFFFFAIDSKTKLL